MAQVSTPERAALDPGSQAARAARGRAARASVSRSSHGDWAPAADRPDPVGVLTRQATTRVADLVPIRHGRMAASAFAFYRGAAAVMAADLAATPHSGLQVQLCGDAHLANFGGFASPERSLVFDLNDFDETLPGPFEWDVKRLAASLDIAGRALGFEAAIRERITASATRSYRLAVHEFAAMTNLDVWYSRLDVATIMDVWGSELGGAAIKRFQKVVTKAGSKDRLKAKTRLTEVVDGELRFASDPPLLVPVRDLFSGQDHQALSDTIEAALDDYRRTLSDDRRHLLETYRFVDLARKVVGVGSVGTRAWVALLVGRDAEDPLFVQIKEAEASVLEPFCGASSYDNHGERVVQGQRLTQAASDIFLGWARIDERRSADGRPHDYYMRALWDWKASADITVMEPETLDMYGQMCAWVLARAHARSGDAIAIAAYLGGGATFDRAIASFSARYGDQNDLDHRRLVDAIATGEVPAQSDI